jgi:O-antigen/teichoic acid export membrane protein
VVGLGSLWLGIHHVESIFYVFYLTPLIGTIAGLAMLPAAVKLLPIMRSDRVESELFKVMKHTAILMATAGLIDYIDVLFVKRYTTPFETGIYGGISQLASAVMVVGYSLASVLNARVARYHDRVHIDAYLRKAVLIALVAIVGFVVYIPLARLSILITIGPDYLPGLEYLKILMISSFMLIATVPFIALFYSYDSPLYFSLSGLGQLAIVLLGGNYLIAEFGLTGAVWVRVASRVFLLLLTLIWAIPAYRKKFSTR